LEGKLIDQNAVASLIQQQITDSVREQIAVLISDPEWIIHVEKRAIEAVSSRIEARFQTLSQDAELSTAVQSGIRSLFEHGFVPDITRYVGTDKFAAAVDTGIYAAIQDVIANLSLDPLWLARVETMVNQQMHTKVNRYVSELQIEQTMRDVVNSALDRWLEANPVARTPGIDDQAQQIELTVMDGTVVVENELAATSVNVAADAVVQGRLTVGDLDITGGIQASKPAWNQLGALAAQLALAELTDQWRQDLVAEVTDMINVRGINLDHVLVGGLPLLTDGALSPHIQHSSLRKLGVLEQLEVGGDVTVGANFTTVTIGARQGAGWIGSGEQPLMLGTDKSNHITMTSDGVTTINQLRVGDLRIGFAAQAPGHRGQRGDIMFNSEPSPGAPVGWQCLGAFNWQSIRGSQ